jgi:hypothetical protein
LCTFTSDPDAHRRFHLSPQAIEHLSISRLHLNFTFGRLKSMRCSVEQAKRGWIEVQRAWRGLSAAWEYLSIHRPRIAGQSLAADNLTQLSDYMGAFTYEESVAQLLFAAGLPV